MEERLENQKITPNVRKALYYSYSNIPPFSLKKNNSSLNCYFNNKNVKYNNKPNLIKLFKHLEIMNVYVKKGMNTFISSIDQKYQKYFIEFEGSCVVLSFITDQHILRK